MGASPLQWSACLAVSLHCGRCYDVVTTCNKMGNQRDWLRLSEWALAFPVVFLDMYVLNYIIYILYIFHIQYTIQCSYIYLCRHCSMSCELESRVCDFQPQASFQMQVSEQRLLPSKDCMQLPCAVQTAGGSLGPGLFRNCL